MSKVIEDADGNKYVVVETPAFTLTWPLDTGPSERDEFDEDAAGCSYDEWQERRRI